MLMTMMRVILFHHQAGQPKPKSGTEGRIEPQGWIASKEGGLAVALLTRKRLSDCYSFSYSRCGSVVTMTGKTFLEAKKPCFSASFRDAFQKILFFAEERDLAAVGRHSFSSILPL